MAQQMITLEEAAEKLNITPDEMKKRLKTDPEFKRLSPIRDGATVRFKLSAIEELARELGMSSETDLPLAPMAEDEPGSDDFKVPGADDKKKGKKSDADVPLNFDSGSSEDDVFSLADDSKAAPSPKSSAKLTPNKPAKGMSDSSSGSSDSDVKLGSGKKKPKSDEATVPTEEIALDFSGPGSAVIKGGSSAKLSAPKTGSSPGKLSSPDTGTGTGKLTPDPAKKSDSAKKSDAKKSSRRSDALRGTPGGPPADSSEFELSLDADSDDFELQMSGDSSAGDEVDLGSLPKDKDKGIARGSKSGINLRDPADSGISLEKGKGKDAKGSDSKKKSKGPKDSADDSSDSGTTTAPSNMDFELSLDSSEAASTSKLGAPKSGKLVLDSESDSEFELTLDDSSSSSLEQAALQAEGSEGEDKGDIFETDFEIPPMPEGESGSEAVAVADSDVEKADFEMAPDDSDVTADEPSQSAVVLVDDEDGPKAKKRGAKKPASKASIADVDLGDAGLEEVEDDEDSAGAALKGAKGRRRDEDEDEEEEAPAGAVVERPTKPWGVVPVVFLAPTLLVTLLGVLMGYELLNTMWGYQQPRKPSAPITRGLADAFGMPINE